MASGFIFPTSVYGQISDVFGTNITQYAGTQGFPNGSGLQLGMFGVLFDRTICRLLKAASGVNQFDAVTFQSGNSNDYTVLQTTTVNQYVIGANDRGGSTALVSGNIAWMTTHGVATINVVGGVTANQPLVSSSVAGQLALYTPGTANLSTGVITGYSTQLNIILLNTTTTTGAYPVRFQ